MATSPVIAQVQTTPRSVLTDYAQLLALLGWPTCINPVRPTLVVVQVDRSYGFPAANTPPWQFEAVLRALLSVGQQRIALLRVGAAAWRRGEDYIGYTQLCHAYGVETTPVPIADANLLLLAPLQLDVNSGVVGVQRMRAALGITEQTPCVALLDGSAVGWGVPPLWLRPEVGSTLYGATQPDVLKQAVARNLHFRPPQISSLAHAALDQLAARLARGGAVAALVDRYRWRFSERRVFAGWLRHTDWGRLFQSYSQDGLDYQSIAMRSR